MPKEIIIKSQSISCYSKSSFILITMQSTARDFLMVHYNKTTPWEALHKLLRLTSQLIGKTKETSQVRDSIFTNSLFTWAHSQKAINGRVSQCISAAERSELSLARGEKRDGDRFPSSLLSQLQLQWRQSQSRLCRKAMPKYLTKLC